LTWVDPKGTRRRRCPACGEDLEYQPLPSLPVRAGGSTSLQEPDYPAEARPNDTAPVSEFLAAGSVVLGIVMVVGGAMAQQPLVIIAGFVVMLLITGFFAMFGKKSSLRRTASSSLNWLFPRYPSPPDGRGDR
jgi:hypothetical protein